MPLHISIVKSILFMISAKGQVIQVLLKQFQIISVLFILNLGQSSLPRNVKIEMHCESVSLQAMKQVGLGLCSS